MLLVAATRLPHLFRFLHSLIHSTESGASEAIPAFDTVINATLSVDAFYLVRSSLGAAQQKNMAREARRFLRFYKEH